ncbi:C6 transcription factor [Coccidioides posadasii str. Silveira]|uniref:C6 transcription factor n=1 Tax=Coccidioides posadasii (strain RMSCC 757 / Silveira) TaxID=443226 RepID=E9DHI3_COCPS|nr:C6 transcription factor [Coccidioides posadasii str. Silveira]
MSSTVGGHLLPQNDFDIPLNLAASPSVSAIPDYSGNGGAYQIAAKVDSNPSQSATVKQQSAVGSTVAGAAAAGRGAGPATRPDAPKSKRVRTGCLTCRERHLKCDETLPRCQNCQKSDRLCKRGVRLNFIDTQVAAPPYAVPSSHDWQVNFHDESREIASEYLGGYERYPSLKRETPSRRAGPAYSYRETQAMATPHPGLTNITAEPIFHSTPQAPAPDSAYTEHAIARSPFDAPKHPLAPANELRPYLNTAEEVLLMQVYVEEVGLWMDSMDPGKHFTQILPFHALGEPMLLNALLACGARHLFLVNPSFGEEKALYYYNISTRDLLTCLQDPNRDTVLCATTAVVLNVYEVMCEKAMQRMNHIAGARALIKECRWNAKTTGIGGACFWLNVGMELLSCLHFNWKMAWDPDTWDIDMNMSLNQGSIAGDEEFWTHRMLYICAKIANYRATMAYQGLDRSSHDPRLNQRCEEWNALRAWCDEWARCAPRSMMPLGYLHPWETNSKSSFPEVWLIKRSAVVGRLFYHTACCLLAKVHPTESEYSDDMLSMQHTHAHDICGIVAHVKDRGVASVSIRCLAIAAECVVGREAQEEVIAILDKIIKETGWQVGFLQHELIEKWGWNSATSHMSPHQSQHPQMAAAGPSTDLGSSLLNSALPSAPPSRPRMPQGIVNPLMATADFSFDNHPYQNHYVAPHNNHLNNYHYGSY